MIIISFRIPPKIDFDAEHTQKKYYFFSAHWALGPYFVSGLCEKIN